jgi:AmiR/NasT family two-component response regulator
MADGAKRVQKHRDKMKAAGFKPVTIWVPDVNAPGVKEQIARDIAIINADADSFRVMEQMLSVADFSDWV